MPKVSTILNLIATVCNKAISGWIDWNLLVDYEGGPNHLNNYCDASMFTLQDYSDVYLQPKFYYFAHFSKFVKPGDVRVQSTVIGNYDYADIEVNVKV